LPRICSFTTLHMFLKSKKVKVKCTLVQALTLCTGPTAHRGSRGIGLLSHDHGTRRGWGVSITPRSLFTPGKDPAPIVQEAGWAPEPVWTCAENLATTGIRSSDHPARSRSLYRLSYLPHKFLKGTAFFFWSHFLPRNFSRYFCVSWQFGSMWVLYSSLHPSNLTSQQ